MTDNLNSRRRRLLRLLLVIVLSLCPTILMAQRGKVSLNLRNEEVSQFYSPSGEADRLHVCLSQQCTSIEV